jgi:hypothetical protein
MPPAEDLARCIVSVLAVAAVAATRLPWLRRFERQGLGFAAAAGVAVFFNFGIFHHYDLDATYVHTWEQFHYQLGSKYFPELGFDGLYGASLAAQEESDPTRPKPEWVRHQPTNQVLDVRIYRPYVLEIRGRFTPERWREFVADHAVYLANPPDGRFWSEIRMDHGYNPSPAWTFVARLFSARLPTGWGSLRVLAGLDVAILVAVFALVFRTWGYRVGCLGMAIAGLGFEWQFTYVGAFLRLDWLLGVVACVCLLERKRFAWAGACLGYATAVRLFPILLATGPLILACRALLRGERPGWALRFGAGLGAALALGVAVGGATGRGPEAWLEFARRMQTYQSFLTPNTVALDTILATAGPEFLRRFGSLEAVNYVDPISADRLDDRRAAVVLSKAALLALVGVAMWRSASLVQATILGSAVLFAVSRPPAYYWILLLLVPALPRQALALGVLCLWTLLHLVAIPWSHPFYTVVWFGLEAWGLLALFVAMSVSAIRGDPGAGAAPGETARGQPGIGSPAKNLRGFSTSS